MPSFIICVHGNLQIIGEGCDENCRNGGTMSTPTPQQQQRTLSMLSFDKKKALTLEQIEALLPDLPPETVFSSLTRAWFRSEVGTVMALDEPLWFRVMNNKDIRIGFIERTGCVRLRFSLNRGGHTLHVSVPKDGIWVSQLTTIKDVFKALMGQHGNYVVEIAATDSIQIEENWVGADMIDSCLSRLGVPVVPGDCLGLWRSLIHPDLLKMEERYGLAASPKAARSGASWIAPGGELISLGAVSHPESIYLLFGDENENHPVG